MPKPRKLARWCIDGYPGWIFDRGGVAYHRFGQAMESLRIAFAPENEKLGLEYLKKRREEYRKSVARRLLGIEDEGPKRREVVSLDGIVTAFEDATYPHIGVNETNNLKRPIRYYLTFNLEWNRADKEERIAAARLILSELEKRHVAPGLAPNTRRAYIGALARVFTWMIDRGYLDTNPATKLTKPTKSRGTRRTRWLPEECEVILLNLERVRARRAYGLLVHFLMLTGMRPGEALKLTRKDAATDYLPATGKGATREIPVRTLPGLREVLDDLLGLPPAPGRAWLLFPWSSLGPLRKAFNEAVRRAAIPRKERTLYGCRKSAIWWMEHDLLFNRQDIFDMVGHDEDVDDEHYRERPKGKDLEDRITRRIRNVAA